MKIGGSGPAAGTASATPGPRVRDGGRNGPTELELVAVVDAIAEHWPDRECIVWRDRRIVWRELDDRTRCLASVLRQHGLGVHRDGSGRPWESRHDHLGLYLLNGPEYLEGVIAAHRARLAPFNINYRYVEAELAALMNDAGARVVMYHARFAPLLAQALEEAVTPPLLLQVDDESGEALLPGALAYEEALTAAVPSATDAHPSPDDLHILYTGGTTGTPKGVLWRAGDLVTGPLGLAHADGTPMTIDAVVEAAGGRSGRAMPVPPLMHGAGLWFALGALLAGGTVVMQRKVDRLDFADVVDVCIAERVTSLMLVGDSFARPFVAELERRREGLPTVRRIVSSGAALSQDVKDRLGSVLPQARVVDTLGSSETGPQAVGSEGKDVFAPRRWAAVLDSTRTRRLAPGDPELGWLAQSGPIPLGYLGDRSKTEATFTAVDGIRHAVAGDRARLLEDGRILFVGRDSMTVNSGGEKIFVEEVEGVLRSTAGVTDAVVVGRPSPRWGEELVAIVQVMAGAHLEGEDLARSCRAQLAAYKVPKAFIFGEVRRHQNGKLDYAWARARARNGDG